MRRRYCESRERQDGRLALGLRGRVRGAVRRPAGIHQQQRRAVRLGVERYDANGRQPQPAESEPEPEESEQESWHYGEESRWKLIVILRTSATLWTDRMPPPTNWTFSASTGTPAAGWAAYETLTCWAATRGRMNLRTTATFPTSTYLLNMIWQVTAWGSRRSTSTNCSASRGKRYSVRD